MLGSTAISCVNFIALLCLSFLINKTKLITVPIFPACDKGEINPVKYLELSLVQPEP